MNTLVDYAGHTVTYVLGHSDRELDRLAVQARLIDPITRRFFLDAGIVPGMRVLDVGSGVGDVAFLAAELVGARGEVVGTDRALTALAVARDRADARSLHNVSFCQGDPAEMTFEQPFDAVVGRYVLMFQPNPTAILRKLAAHVRPGGVVVFHEPDRDGIRSFPPVPNYDRGCQMVDETFRLSGVDPRMGIKPPPSASLPRDCQRQRCGWRRLSAEVRTARIRCISRWMLPGLSFPKWNVSGSRQPTRSTLKHWPSGCLLK